LGRRRVGQRRYAVGEFLPAEIDLHDPVRGNMVELLNY
jgi:hypothetical protein